MIAHAVKPAEFDPESLTPRVRAALEQVQGLEPARAAAISIELASLLTELRADEDVLLAGMLIPWLEAGTLDDARAQDYFGTAAVHLAREVERVGGIGIPADWNPGQPMKPQQAEGLRKLLLSLASDVRLVLLRLVLQLVRLRNMKEATPAEQRWAALETREIYAPLANRLGIWQLKWELEDLAFRYSEPD
jgi:GTP pyrophosphokinase